MEGPRPIGRNKEEVTRSDFLLFESHHQLFFIPLIAAETIESIASVGNIHEQREALQQSIVVLVSLSCSSLL